MEARKAGLGKKRLHRHTENHWAPIWHPVFGSPFITILILFPGLGITAPSSGYAAVMGSSGSMGGLIWIGDV